MAAIDNTLVVRDAAAQLMKRANFASRNPGVILVFCIVFIVAVFLLGLFIYKRLQRRKEAKSQLVV